MVPEALCDYQLHLCYLLSAYPFPDDCPVHNFLTGEHEYVVGKLLNSLWID